MVKSKSPIARLDSEVRRLSRINFLDLNEETIKFRVIAPLLENLGWDVQNKKMKPGHENVEFECSVSPKSNERADIVLSSRFGSKVRRLAIVELKASKVSLDSESILIQLEKQAVLRPKIIALTNGYRWKLYLPKQGTTKLADRVFMDFDITSSEFHHVHYSQQFRHFLSRLSLVNDTSVKRAKKLLDNKYKREKDEEIAKQIREVWKNSYSGIQRHHRIAFESMVSEISISLSRKHNRKPGKSVITSIIRNPLHSFDTINGFSTRQSKPGFITIFDDEISIPSFAHVFYEVVRVLHNNFHNFWEIYDNKWDPYKPVLWLKQQEPKKLNQTFTSYKDLPYHMAYGGPPISIKNSYRLLELMGAEQKDLRVFIWKGREVLLWGNKLIYKNHYNIR